MQIEIYSEPEDPFHFGADKVKPKDQGVFNYPESFAEIVEELGQRDDVIVHIAKVFAPASEAEIKSAEENSFEGQEMGEEMKTFYRQMNGVQLVWEYMPNGKTESLFKKYAVDEGYVKEDGSIWWREPYVDDNSMGSILIRPLDRIEVNADLAAIEIDSQQYYPLNFDNYRSFYDVALVATKSNKVGNYIVLGEDHGATYKGYKPFIDGFARYIKFVINTRGAQVFRNELFQRKVPNHLIDGRPDLGVIIGSMV